MPVGTVSLVKVDGKGVKEQRRSVLSNVDVVSAGYHPDNDTLCCMDNYGSLHKVRSDGQAEPMATDGAVLNLDVSTDGRTLACMDNARGLAFVGDAGPHLLDGTSFCSVAANEGAIIACSKVDSSVVFADGNGNSVKTLQVLDLAPLLLLRVIGTYCSGAVLAVMVLVLAVRKVRGAIRTGRVATLGPPLGIAAIAVALMGGLFLFTHNSYEHDVDVRSNEVNMLADTLEKSCPQEIVQSMPHLAKSRNALREGGCGCRAGRGRRDVVSRGALPDGCGKRHWALLRRIRQRQRRPV